MKRIIVLMQLTIICWVLGWAPGVPAATFSPSDLAGTWHFYLLGDSTTSNQPFWSRGTIILDANGNVTSGSATDSEGDTASLTGGSIFLATTGVGSGFATDSTGFTAYLAHLKMDSGKTIATGVMIDSSNTVRGLLVLIKDGGTFAIGDLEGTWHFFHLGDLTTGNLPFWARGTVTLNSGGAITGGTVTDSEGGSTSTVNGAVSQNVGGVGSGSIVFTYPGPTVVSVVISEFKMDTNKTFATGVTVEGPSPNVLRGLFVLIKAGGSFSTSDLDGRWSFHIFGDSTEANSPRWEYGTIAFDASGNVTGGTSIGSDGTSDTFSGGTLSVNSSGVISGTVSDGSISDFKMDMMNQSIFAGVANGSRQLIIGIKGAPALLPTQKVGVYRPSSGFWYLDANGDGIWNGCGPSDLDKCIPWGGLQGDIVVRGDWNGDGRTKIGIFRDGTWYLDANGNGLWDGCGTDKCITWGNPGDIPVVGDWNGDGTSKIGIFRDGTWYLDANGNGLWDGCGTDKCITWGNPGDKPVRGDWNGDRRTKIGVYRPSSGFWYLDYDGNGTFDGCGVDRCISWGNSTDTPVVGDWSGDGRTKIGIFRDGTWYLDANGNGLWDGCGTDKCIAWGDPSDVTVVGRW